MHCPFCGAGDTKVIDSRLVSEGKSVRRRRECGPCGERWTTFENAELLMPKIVKSNRLREPFDEIKLRRGLEKALEKRPVSDDALDAAVNRVMHRLRQSGEREVNSGQVGEAVMGELRRLDPVAYVRFASVYRDFQDVREFLSEIARLEKNQAP